MSNKAIEVAKKITNEKLKQTIEIIYTIEDSENSSMLTLNELKSLLADRCEKFDLTTEKIQG